MGKGSGRPQSLLRENPVPLALPRTALKPQRSPGSHGRYPMVTLCLEDPTAQAYRVTTSDVISTHLHAYAGVFMLYALRIN